MKNLFPLGLFLVSVLSGFSTMAQNALNVTEIGHLAYNQELSEVRGALHNGSEYALVGAYNGFSIVDLNDPSTPVEVFFEPGPNSTWRDPFYHNGHAYCVTEGGGGLLIVDMSPLPNSTNLPTTLYTGSTYDISTCHNMFIDSDNDKAYLFGGNQIDGAIILDITHPMAPVELGIWNEYYIHDGFVRGDTLWAACLEDGAFVVDVSVPTSPVVLANWDTPSEFAHNIWPTDDNAFCYTTDEVNSGYIASYDMSDLQNVVETDRNQHPLSEGVIPHNAHFLNDYVVTAHYRDGLTIHDVSDPTNVVLTGYYDSSPMAGGGFNGAWGTWPYLPSGNLLVSDIEEGLFVLGATYKRAARFEGNVTEMGTGNPLNGVQIEVVAAGLEENTDLFGNYATGVESAGTYSVIFQKGGYITQTISNVVLTNGQTTVLDVELEPDVPFVMQGTVIEAGTGLPIEGASVQLTNDFFDVSLITDAQGIYSDNSFFVVEYEVSVGSWGYVGQCLTVNPDTQNPSLPNIELESGYADDFSMDLGWSIEGNATAGVWVRDYPIGTDYDGTPANPSEDADGDCGGQAFITGNFAGAVHLQDVDDGMTVLLSPSMDLSSFSQASLQFDYWFFNDGGNSTPNDQLIIKMNDGTGLTTIASLPTTNDVWTEYSVSLNNLVSFTGDMQLRVEIRDSDPGHLVEAGIDRFRIVSSTSLEEVGQEPTISLYPNPVTGSFVNVFLPNEVNSATAQLLDITGKVISSKKVLGAGTNRLDVPVAMGVYLVEIMIDNKRTTQRLFVH